MKNRKDKKAEYEKFKVYYYDQRYGLTPQFEDDYDEVILRQTIRRYIRQESLISYKRAFIGVMISFLLLIIIFEFQDGKYINLLLSIFEIITLTIGIATFIIIPSKNLANIFMVATLTFSILSFIHIINIFTPNSMVIPLFILIVCLTISYFLSKNIDKRHYLKYRYN